MSFTRRDFLATSASTLALGLGSRRALAQPAAAPPPETKFVDLRRGVGMFIGTGGTIGYLVNGAGAVAIDSQFANTATIAVAGLKTRSPKGIEMLLNTHHHGDHTGGNLVFRGAVNRIVSHVNCLEWHRKTAAAAKAESQTSFADTTFTDSWKSDFGDETIQARYYGPGHTSGDSVVRFQNANIVHMGDLMFYLRNPRVDRGAGASIKNWIVTLESVAKDNPADTIYIAGHSKVNLPLNVMRADLLKFRDYFSGLLAYVQKGIASGRSAAEIVKVASVPGFTDYEGSPEGTIQAAYDELTAKG